MPGYTSTPVDGRLLQAGTDGVQAVIDVAQAAAKPSELEAGFVHVLALGDGKHTLIDLTGDEHRDTPSRKRGTTTVRDVPSFLDYFGKHGDDDSEVYGDVRQLRITAVLDAHTSSEGPRWGGHRLVLELRKTDVWTQWMDQDTRLVPQDQFASFIEDHLPELVEPDAATMLELAQSFEATTKADFESSQRLDSGQRRFSYVEDTQAKAGQRGEITIPETFKIGIRPFDGAEPYALIARFRYRLDKGDLRLGFKLQRPSDVLEAAFSDTVAAVSEAIPQQVLNGTPAADRN